MLWDTEISIYHFDIDILNCTILAAQCTDIHFFICHYIVLKGQFYIRRQYCQYNALYKSTFYSLTYLQRISLWQHPHSSALIFRVWHIFDEKCVCAVQMGWRMCLAVRHLHACHYRSCVTNWYFRHQMLDEEHIVIQQWWSLGPNCHQLLQQLTATYHLYLKFLHRKVLCRHWSQPCAMFCRYGCDG